MQPGESYRSCTNRATCHLSTLAAAPGAAVQAHVVCARCTAGTIAAAELQDACAPQSLPKESPQNPHAFCGELLQKQQHCRMRSAEGHHRTWQGLADANLRQVHGCTPKQASKSALLGGLVKVVHQIRDVCRQPHSAHLFQTRGLSNICRTVHITVIGKAT